MTDKAPVQAVAALLTEDLDEDQLDLLAPPETERGRALVGPEVEVKRGPGRPPGARNKRTARVVAWLLSKYRDPREALLAVVDMHPADLAALLHCSVLEAFGEWRQCAATVLPFVAQRQPLAIDVTNKQAVYLTIVDGASSPENPGAPILEARVVDIQQNQEVSDDDATKD